MMAMNSFNAFRSATLSLLHRPHVRTIVTKIAEKPKGKKAKGPLRDQDIPFRLVRLVDPETSKLSDLQPLSPIIQSLDRRSHYVELIVSEPSPVVKILNRYEEANKAAQAAFRARESARHNAKKEVQLSWKAAPGDFAHKMGKVRAEISRGARVDLVFSRKEGQPKMSVHEMHSHAEEVVKSLADVAKEWKTREVRARQGLFAVFLEGTGKAESSSNTSDVAAEPEPAQASVVAKRIAITSVSTPADVFNAARKARKELLKNAYIELVLSTKASTGQVKQPLDEDELRKASAVQDIPPLDEDELRSLATKLVKELTDVAKEWRDRDYKPVYLLKGDRDDQPVASSESKPTSAKLTVFLERLGGPPKGRAVIIKGPKQKKMKEGGIQDLYQD